MPGIEVVSEDADASRREARRKTAAAASSSASAARTKEAAAISVKPLDALNSSSLGFLQAREAALEASVRRSMGEGGDEAGFAVEAPLEAQAFLWSDKYRPRKPRYFNRVHTVM